MKRLVKIRKYCPGCKKLIKGVEVYNDREPSKFSCPRCGVMLICYKPEYRLEIAFG